MRRHGAYARPGAIAPWVHNAAAGRRKKYRRVARQMRAAARTPSSTAAAFRALGLAADRAAESLRRLRDVL